MKRISCVLIVILLLLTGCDMPFINPATTEPIIFEVNEDPFENPTEVPEETAGLNAESDSVIYEQQPLYAISMPIVTNIDYSEDGATVFQYTYQDMSLTFSEQDVADCIIIDYLNRMDELSALIEEFTANAQSLYSPSNAWMEHYYNIYYSPTRIDQEVLSLYGISSSYTGSRPVQSCSAINYSTLTGDVLTLGSILRHIDSKVFLVDLVIEKATAIQNDVHLFNDYADCIKERFEKEESFDEDWYFTDTGLCFYFSPYEIAPYSSGIVTLEIPYNELTGIIADDFFPPEEEIMLGTLCTMQRAESEANNFTQQAKLSIDESGEQVLLYAQGALLDVQIKRGHWDDYNRFIPDYTVFACNSLTPGDCILLMVNIPDTMPTLQITYRNGDEVQKQYLIQSSVDSSIILTNYS